MGKPSRRPRRAEAKVAQAQTKEKEEWVDAQFDQNRWVFWLAYALSALPILIVVMLATWLPDLPQPVKTLLLLIATGATFYMFAKAASVGGSILYFHLKFVKKVRMPSEHS